MAFDLRTSFRTPVVGPLNAALTSATTGNQTLPDEISFGLWSFSTTYQLYRGNSPVQMMLNPTSVRWSRAKRLVKNDTLDGSVFTHFLDRNGRNNDLIKLEFSGNTGNIDLRGSLVSEDDLAAAAGFLGARGTAADRALADQIDTGALRKLITFHKLRQMSEEPVIFTVQSLEDTESTEVVSAQTSNEFLIQYVSPLFPSNILISGIYASPVQFEESGENPNSVDYTFDFWVKEITPDTDMFLSLLESATAEALRQSAQAGA